MDLNIRIRSVPVDTGTTGIDTEWQAAGGATGGATGFNTESGATAKCADEPVKKKLYTGQQMGATGIVFIAKLTPLIERGVKALDPESEQSKAIALQELSYVYDEIIEDSKDNDRYENIMELWALYAVYENYDTNSIIKIQSGCYAILKSKQVLKELKSNSFCIVFKDNDTSTFTIAPNYNKNYRHTDFNLPKFLVANGELILQELIILTLNKQSFIRANKLKIDSCDLKSAIIIIIATEVVFTNNWGAENVKIYASKVTVCNMQLIDFTLLDRDSIVELELNNLPLDIIPYFPNLKKLSLNNMKSNIKISQEYFGQLEELNINGSPVFIGEIKVKKETEVRENVKTCTSNVTMRGMYNPDILKFSAYFIVELTLEDLTLDTLPDLPNLKKLILNKVKSLENISKKHYKQLEVLHVSGCPDFIGRKKISGIIDLKFIDCPNLCEDIELYDIKKIHISGSGVARVHIATLKNDVEAEISHNNFLKSITMHDVKVRDFQCEYNPVLEKVLGRILPMDNGDKAQTSYKNCPMLNTVRIMGFILQFIHCPKLFSEKNIKQILSFLEKNQPQDPPSNQHPLQKVCIISNIFPEKDAKELRQKTDDQKTVILSNEEKLDIRHIHLFNEINEINKINEMGKIIYKFSNKGDALLNFLELNKTDIPNDRGVCVFTQDTRDQIINPVVHNGHVYTFSNLAKWCFIEGNNTDPITRLPIDWSLVFKISDNTEADSNAT